MGAAFGNSLVGDIHNLVAALDGGKAVGDDKGGPAFKKLVECGLELPFGFGVN